MRYEVTKSAIKAYRTMAENEENEIRPMHRPKNWHRTEREEQKEEKRTGIARWIRFSPVYTIDIEMETKEDVHECDTKQWIGDKGGGKNRRNVQKRALYLMILAHVIGSFQ